jgi:hypothetical protein
VVWHSWKSSVASSSRPLGEAAKIKECKPISSLNEDYLAFYWPEDRHTTYCCCLHFQNARKEKDAL